MKKSISKRLKITGTGKVLRRAMALGHSRTNKTTTQMQRKKHMRHIDMAKKVITHYIGR